MYRIVRKIFIWKSFAVKKYGDVSRRLIWKSYIMLTIFYFVYTWVGIAASLIRQKESVMSELFLYFLFGKTNILMLMVKIKLKEAKLKRVVTVILNTLKRQSYQRYFALVRRYQKAVLGACCYTLVMSVLSSAFGLSASGRQEAEKSVSVFSWYCDVANWNPLIVDLLIVADSVTYFFFSVGQFICFCLAFMFVASALTHLAQNVNDKMELMNNETKTFFELLPVVRKDLNRLRYFVHELNECLQICILNWYLEGLVFTCIGLNRMVSVMGRSYSSTSVWIWPFHLLDYFQYTFLVLIVTVLGSKLPSTVEQGLPLLHKMSELPAQIDIGGQILLLQAQVSSPVIAFSVGGCSNMTKSLLISYLGLLITYVIVYVQMSPDLLNLLRHLGSNASIRNGTTDLP